MKSKKEQREVKCDATNLFERKTQIQFWLHKGTKFLKRKVSVIEFNSLLLIRALITTGDETNGRGERERVMAVGVAVDYDSSVLETKNPPQEDFAW